MRKTFVAFAFAFALCNIAQAQEKHNDILVGQEAMIDIIRELNIGYVDSVDNKALYTTAINAMLASLDPYTVYIPAERDDYLRQLTTGDMGGGIGATLRQEGDYILIVEEMEGLPVHKAGLLAGDLITEVDGKSIKGKPVADVTKLLRGTPGTEVEITVRRATTTKPIKAKLIRENITRPAISFAGMIDESTALIKVDEFTESVSESFKNHLATLAATGKMKQLIVDLRYNVGGNVGEAVDMLSLFLPKHTKVLTMKMKDGNGTRTYATTLTPIYADLPLAVLVNEGTASAAEIFAGAIQDLDRGIILGTRTFGKGLVQNIKALNYDGNLKMTVAKYYTPSGRCIQAIDYANKSENRNKPIPDSLTHTFKTTNGRIVRDGRGITPDSTLTEEEGTYIAYNLYTKNIMFDYAVRYHRMHPSIAEPTKFALSDADYDDFINFVKSKNFTYELESARGIKYLEEQIAYDGYSEQTQALIEQLKQILQPDIQKDLQQFKSSILEYLEGEIVTKYYYNKGYNAYVESHDKWVKTAINILSDPNQLNQILSPKK
ncbi:MAG: S41 family peptidase [Bacteroidales bacterium]|nr:S41 family peptidase [Bacteroidales bacterium]